MAKQREIKYKVWDKNNKKFIPQSITKDLEITIRFDGVFVSDNVRIDGTKNGEDLILLQYTGLTDKHGKEIYEGDIVSYMDKTLIVEWSECRWAFVYPNNEDVLDGFYVYTYKLNKKMEVIGNIYENKNLLNKTNL